MRRQVSTESAAMEIQYVPFRRTPIPDPPPTRMLGRDERMVMAAVVA
jgi:hypothetical protein